MSRKVSAELFPTDEPLGADRMIGREDDVAEVAQALTAGLSLIVAAPRRTGKTSVCNAAMGRAKKAGLYVVAIDLFSISSAAELAETLVAQSVANRPGLRRLVHKARQAGRMAAKSVSAVMKLHGELGEEVDIAFKPGLADRDPDRYLTYALELPQRIAEADGKRAVVFFDEFQEVAGPGNPFGEADRLTKRMRSIFQRSGRVSYLFAGSVEHLMRDLFTPRRRAFYQFGGFHELRPIDAGAWTKGLRRRFAEDRCEVEDAALERIISLGELHPRATMLIAQQTHLASLALERRDFDSAMVEQGYRAALERDRPNHEQTVERIRRLQKHALPVVKGVAQGTSAYKSLPADAAYRALRALRHAGLIESGGRGEWHVTDPLLRRYLADLQPII